MLRLSLEPDPTARDLPLRQGRAIGWFTEALAPLVDDLGPDGVRRVAVAVRAVAGIEPLVWPTDVAGMSTGEAIEQMVWSALAVLRRATEGHPAGCGPLGAVVLRRLIFSLRNLLNHPVLRC